MTQARFKRNVKRSLSLWSRRKFAELDGRLEEAREEKRLIHELTRHVGQPSIPQAIMIRRAARLLLMLMTLERRVLEKGQMGDLAARQICALHNALRLSLSALGLERHEQKVPAISEFLTAHRRDAA